jgi:hypothetical protein
MYMAWKVLLPIAMVLVVAVGTLVLLPATRNGFPWDRWVGWPLVGLLFVFLVFQMLGAYRTSVRRNRALAA